MGKTIEKLKLTTARYQRSSACLNKLGENIEFCMFSLIYLLEFVNYAVMFIQVGVNNLRYIKKSSRYGRWILFLNYGRGIHSGLLNIIFIFIYLKLLLCQLLYAQI